MILAKISSYSFVHNQHACYVKLSRSHGTGINSSPSCSIAKHTPQNAIADALIFLAINESKESPLPLIFHIRYHAMSKNITTKRSSYLHPYSYVHTNGMLSSLIALSSSCEFIIPCASASMRLCRARNWVYRRTSLATRSVILRALLLSSVKMFIVLGGRCRRNTAW